MPTFPLTALGEQVRVELPLDIRRKPKNLQASVDGVLVGFTGSWLATVLHFLL